MKRIVALAVTLLLLLPGSARAGTPATFPPQTASSGCVVQNAEPDPACTPGAVLPVTAAQVCVSGYATSVRDVTEDTKRQVYAEYGLSEPQVPGAYEVDHLVSLELGGSNDIANLWPEAASPQPGYHQKDGLEDYLHDQVCSGKMALADAQTAIATDWLSAWQAAGEPGGSTIAPTQPPAPGPVALPVQPAQPAAPASSSGCVSYTGGPCVTQCKDGQWSSASGRGTCSGHGGEAP